MLDVVRDGQRLEVRRRSNFGSFLRSDLFELYSLLDISTPPSQETDKEEEGRDTHRNVAMLRNV